MKTIYIILKEDIMYFPPILTIINTLCDIGYKVVHLGTYSDEEGRKLLEDKGMVFVKMPSYNGNGNIFQKLRSQLRFRKQVENYIDSVTINSDDRIWLAQIETIYLLHDLVKKYPTILHPLEYTDPKIKWSYKLISPSLKLPRTFREATKVVCCEYNRAHITKGLFTLEKLPVVLPNKPYDDKRELSDNILSHEISSLLSKYKEKTKNKKVILYQGIFLDKERRLEEFCQAISLLPEEYVLVAMGTGSDMYERLREQYESERIIFIPFIKPPYHLLVTKDAYIGVLSYFPRPNNIGTVINPLYCAPNKIFEYAKFGKPMLANDIPGLKYIFKEFDCGVCIDYPMTPKAIASCIMELNKNYSLYSMGAIKYYNSVDINSIISNIVC